MPSRALANLISDRAVSALWSHWDALGLGGGGRPTQLILDPEALLVATWTVGRCAPRLFDGALGWCRENERLVDLQRLKTFLSDEDEEVRRVAGAWASTLAQTAARRWRSLGQEPPGGGSAVALFVDASGAALPAIGPIDGTFERYGWRRGPIAPSTALRVPDARDPGCERLLMRALAGVGVRAELLAILLTTEEATTAEMATRAGYSQRAVQLALREMAPTGLFEWRRQRGSSKPVRLDGAALAAALQAPHRSEAQGRAQRVEPRADLRALTEAWRLAKKLGSIPSDAGRAHVLERMAEALQAGAGNVHDRGQVDRRSNEHPVARVERLLDRVAVRLTIE